MKRPKFLTLIMLHLLFVFFAFLVYFSQYCLYMGDTAENLARVYAMSLFIPNVIGMTVLYFSYLAWLLGEFSKGKKIKWFKLHISYNLLLISGLSVELLQTKNASMADSFFILAETAAILIALVIIFNKNKKYGYAHC
ncbi:MAG: hypothetical protein UY41_C0013G0002 [Candidatus Moranbacteria bacterium GW2011_GWE1_49_15]|nr:MAG: hypothetical protein UX75_C0007G0031 [Candidatus Moranbacteria bacterium GW2011_GWE2_47_10]KKW06837.1 MAG: hypothetical protein UY41_C0013G0002 [Candidatus Moranbacteria bacterium GW2011_GWE1_49_15]HBP01367.1 hypothetical protein [Candidatus Moranbacteria bacterium]